jgi:hypothetical protein
MVKEDGRRTAAIDQEKTTIPDTYDYLTEHQPIPLERRS